MPNKRKSRSSQGGVTTNTKQAKLSVDSDVDNVVKKIETLYGMKLPKDFKFFWKLCLEIDPKNPLGKLNSNISRHIYSFNSG